MQPTLYHKLLKLISKHHIKTLTVDIYDTVLYNEYWPSDLRYYDLAIKWLPILQRAISPKLTAYEIYSWRIFARHELERLHQPVRLDLWCDALITLLAHKYQTALTSDQYLELLSRLIAIELEFTINNTHPNYPLLAQLQALKRTNPELKVYFVADSALTAVQIKTICDILQIQVFDNGICSSDLNQTKQNGELYEQLTREFSPEFDLMHNLHLGDQRIPDYLIPIRHDSCAIHYRPIRMRGLRTLVGKMWMQILHLTARFTEKRHLQQVLTSCANLGEGYLTYGLLCQQDRLLSAWQVILTAQLQPETKYILLNHNSNKLPEHIQKALIAENININHQLTLSSIVQAFVWLLATFHAEHWDNPKLLQLVLAEANITKCSQLYQLCFTEDYVSSQLLQSFCNEPDFYQHFLTEVCNAKPEFTSPLRSAYEALINLLPPDYQSTCFITNQPDRTISLFREFLRLHNNGTNISEWLLPSPNDSEIHLNPRRQSKANNGAALALPTLQQSQLAPDAYRKYIINPTLKKLRKSLS